MYNKTDNQQSSLKFMIFMINLINQCHLNLYISGLYVCPVYFSFDRRQNDVIDLSQIFLLKLFRPEKKVYLIKIQFFRYIEKINFIFFSFFCIFYLFCKGYMQFSKHWNTRTYVDSSFKHKDALQNFSRILSKK